MAAIQDEVREWLLSQPDWLQDAADKILKNGQVTREDIATLTVRIKTADGQAVTKNREFAELLHSANANQELRLISIGNIEGIDNLVPRQPLTFGAGNLSVVYGHNGSGKSSYTRLLKKAAGKPRARPVLANVFRAPPLVKKCNIGYTLADSQTLQEWNADSGAIDALRSIDIFDNEEGNNYLSSENAASYTPPIVGLFESLANACDQIKAQLQHEQNQLVPALPALPPIFIQTKAGQAFQALKADMLEEDILALASWSDLHELEQKQIVDRLRAENPAVLAKQKRAQAAQMRAMVEALRLAQASFGSVNLSHVRNLHAAAKLQRQIATEAAQVKSARFAEVGQKTWASLWEAARAYSAIAYQGQAFPVTTDARCVLCHQELAPEAQQRLQDFENFVQGQMETAARAAEDAYSNALKAFTAIPHLTAVKTQCEAAGLDVDAWAPHMENLWKSAIHIRDALLKSEADGQVQAMLEIEPTVKNLLEGAANLEAQGQQFDIDAQGFDRPKAEVIKLNLDAKRWISQQEIAVRAEIGRKKQLMNYEAWKSLANSRPVSNKSGAVSERVITDAYIDRFNAELALLGASHLKVDLIKSKIDKGRALHKLQLRGVQAKQDLMLVLSEGERRIISLAAFLADVADKPQAAPFVFDDPISSLDHEFEWHVASRLAKLAMKRQVLVFTHRLSLYGTIEDVAKKIGLEWKDNQRLCIESFLGVAGNPVDNATWNTNTKAANNLLITRLDNARKVAEEQGGEAYRNLAQGICSDYRKLLERTVEDDLLNSIVRRHRRSVTTDNKLQTLHFIEPKDCEVIDRLMTKYSCYEHSQSQEQPIFIPEEPELRLDLLELKCLRENLASRREKGKKADSQF